MRTSSRFAEFCGGYFKKMVTFPWVKQIKSSQSYLCVTVCSIRYQDNAVQTDQICHQLRRQIEKEACVCECVCTFPFTEADVCGCVMCFECQLPGNFTAYYIPTGSARVTSVTQHCCSDITGALTDTHVCFRRGQTGGDRDHRGPCHAHPGDLPVGCHHQHHCRWPGTYQHTH